MTLLSLLLLLPAAPVPPVRSLRPAALAGDWRMALGGATYRVMLGRTGGYVCQSAGFVYVGTWRVEGRAIHFEERPLFPRGVLGSALRWKATVSPWRLAGQSDTFGMFALTREKP